MNPYRSKITDVRPVPWRFARAFVVFIALLFCVTFVPTNAGCAGQTAAVVLTEVEAGITDAEIAIATVAAGVDAYFAAHPNATLQTQIDNAVADTETALRAVNSALAGATSVSDGNVQAALAAFSQAYSALMQLVAQIGIQTAPAGTAAVRTPSGGLLIPPPRILSLVKPGVAPAASVDALVPAPKVPAPPAPAAPKH